MLLQYEVCVENYDGALITSQKGVNFLERRKQLFYRRLTREMAIRCNRWWLKKAVNSNYIHSSWDTGNFIPIPVKFIVDNGAYCHIKGNIGDNPKE